MIRFVEENGELPSALRDLVAFYRSPEGNGRLKAWEDLASPKEVLQFAGMGTSEFTSEAMANRLSARGRHSRSFDAGELCHQAGRQAVANGLFTLTSQSGESVEIRHLAALEWIGRYVAVTNDEGSTLARGAALTLPLCAGREDTITTKTYVNNLALFRLLESRLEGTPQTGRMLDALEEAADGMETLDETGIEAAADKLMQGRKEPVALAFAGRGDAVVSARQCGLTFMEGLKRPACAFAGGSFRHGPFECAGPELGVILFRAPVPTLPLTDGLARDAAAHGSPVVILDACGAPPPGQGAVIRLPRAAEGDACGLFPLLAARTHNQLLHVLATRLGLETGLFRHGGKVTTKE